MNMYFIALVLPPDLNEKVLHWKKLMQERYNCKVGLKSPAHITLVPPFWMEENKEANLLQGVNALAKNNFPFVIHTKNFSAFKPRTIFIDVLKNADLVKVKTNADEFFKLQIFIRHGHSLKKKYLTKNGKQKT